MHSHKVAVVLTCLQMQDNFKRWNDALQTKNAATVANMYTSDPSFLPTVSPKHIKKGGVGTDTEDYFVEFVKKNPFGTITDDKVQVFAGGDAYLHSGLYTFELGDAGARTPVEARFSYVWKKVGGDWKIAHHHSSVTPGVAPAAPDMAKMATLARVCHFPEPPYHSTNSTIPTPTSLEHQLSANHTSSMGLGYDGSAVMWPRACLQWLPALSLIS